VLTPDLGRSFPDLLFFTYFATHSGALAAACLLVFGARRAPRPDAAWRVYAITVAFTGLAAVGTLLTGGNYMFLRRKPAQGSLLDFMGPWPVYILVAALFGLLMFLVLAALARPISARSTSGGIEQRERRSAKVWAAGAIGSTPTRVVTRWAATCLGTAGLGSRSIRRRRCPARGRIHVQ
jgi:hypothetical protein